MRGRFQLSLSVGSLTGLFLTAVDATDGTDGLLIALLCAAAVYLIVAAVQGSGRRSDREEAGHWIGWGDGGDTDGDD